MKVIITVIVLLGLVSGISGGSTFPSTPFGTKEADARVKYINGYTRSNGTYVSGHYRDTSNDGNSYNNANYLGYNGLSRK